MKRKRKQSASSSILLTKPAEFIRARFPSIHETCLRHGIDITAQPIPVVPTAHYQCGGVKTDLNGETSLRGFYAIRRGRSAPGLHGCQLAWPDNSLLEGLVLAHQGLGKIDRAVAQAAPRDFDLPEWRPGQVQDLDEFVVIYHNWDEIRRLMWDYVGIVRDRTSDSIAQPRALRNLACRDSGILLELQSFDGAARAAQFGHELPL